tara:strand:- start:181 stop:432 length:252 start_codon:yes stop_codon:yes gene_type:complete
MGRARYKGQKVGDEQRPEAAALAEHYEDNAVIEGPVIERLAKMFKAQNWVQFEEIIAQLREDGWNEKRIDAVTAASTRGKISL